MFQKMPKEDTHHRQPLARAQQTLTMSAGGDVTSRAVSSARCTVSVLVLLVLAVMCLAACSTWLVIESGHVQRNVDCIDARLADLRSAPHDAEAGKRAAAVLDELPSDVLEYFHRAAPYLGYFGILFASVLVSLMLCVTVATCNGRANGKGFVCSKVLSVPLDAWR